jgi:hypothetical protein
MDLLNAIERSTVSFRDVTKQSAAHSEDYHEISGSYGGLPFSALFRRPEHAVFPVNWNSHGFAPPGLGIPTPQKANYLPSPFISAGLINRQMS